MRCGKRCGQWWYVISNSGVLVFMWKWNSCLSPIEKPHQPFQFWNTWLDATGYGDLGLNCWNSFYDCIFSCPYRWRTNRAIMKWERIDGPQYCSIWWWRICPKTSTKLSRRRILIPMSLKEQHRLCIFSSLTISCVSPRQIRNHWWPLNLSLKNFQLSQGCNSMWLKAQ